MRAMLKSLVLSMIPPVRRLQEHCDRLSEQHDQLQAELLRSMALRDQALESVRYFDTVAAVLQYREAYYEVRGHIAPGTALPTARAWPKPDTSLSYKEKLTGPLDLSGQGAEIGPLNIPLLSKDESRVLYV